ncbi:glycosyltransferase [Pseudomonas sp. SDO5215_S409]
MHVIITAIGSAGDVHPFVGIGRTLLARGHRVSFCTSAAFASLIERNGFNFLPLGTVEEYNALMADPELWNPKTSLKSLWSAVASLLREQYACLENACDDQTVLLGSLWAFSARLLHEKKGVPLITAQVSPYGFWSSFAPSTNAPGTNLPDFVPYPVRRLLLNFVERAHLDRTIAPALNEFRAQLGLAPVKHIISRWICSPGQALGLFPDWFAPVQRDWPAGTLLTGFPLFDDPEAHEPDIPLERFLSEAPPVVFTPGSTLVDADQYFAAAAQALKLTRRRGLFLTSQPVDPALLADGTILVRRYVPLSSILARCAALVHHGGIGTLALAIAAAIPQVATPFAHDQFDNAARMVRLGCGVQVFAPLTGESLAAALETALNSDDIRANCQRYQTRISHGQSAGETVAQRLEALVRPATGAPKSRLAAAH